VNLHVISESPRYKVVYHYKNRDLINISIQYSSSYRRDRRVHRNLWTRKKETLL